MYRVSEIVLRMKSDLKLHIAISIGVVIVGVMNVPSVAYAYSFSDFADISRQAVARIAMHIPLMTNQNIVRAQTAGF